MLTDTWLNHVFFYCSVSWTQSTCSTYCISKVVQVRFLMQEFRESSNVCTLRDNTRADNCPKLCCTRFCDICPNLYAGVRCFATFVRISVLLFIIVCVYMHKKGYSKKHLGVEEGGGGVFPITPSFIFLQENSTGEQHRRRYRRTVKKAELENSIGGGKEEQHKKRYRRTA